MFTRLFSNQVLVSGRVLTAIIGGYLLAMILSLWISHFSGLSERSARSLTSMMFFLLYTAIIMAVFAYRSHVKAITTPWIVTIVAWLAWWLAVEEAP
jgi:small-conductance mechanosensitive channel